MSKRFAIAALTLAACRLRRRVRPSARAGKTLPQKPALASRALTANELLESRPLPTRAGSMN
jgi:hypothetical protein